MNRISLKILLGFVLLSRLAQAQINNTPQLLKKPADWQFERFALPPQFAPGFVYKGAEELRFSPGMFIKDSITYFTYAFVAQIDNIRSMSQSDIKNYLIQYFKGLCSSTAKDRKLSIDTSRISVELEKKKNTGNETIYNAVLHIFGVFADGAPVKLIAEIKALQDSSNSKIYLVFIASPHEKSDPIWTKLYAIQKDFTIP